MPSNNAVRANMNMTSVDIDHKPRTFIFTIFVLGMEQNTIAQLNAILRKTCFSVTLEYIPVPDHLRYRYGSSDIR
jgi:hypothetical protein